MVCSIRSKTVNIQNNEDVDHLGPWKQECNVDCHHSKHLDLIFQSVRQHILLQYTLLYVKSILLGDGGLRMNDVFIQITAWFLRVFFFFSFKNNCIYLFIAVLGLHCCVGFSPVQRAGGLRSSCSAKVSHCGGFPCGAQAWWHLGSVVAVPGLQRTGSIVVVHGLSCFMATRDLPSKEIKPISPALAGGFLYHWATREALPECF